MDEKTTEIIYGLIWPTFPSLSHPLKPDFGDLPNDDASANERIVYRHGASFCMPEGFRRTVTRMMAERLGNKIKDAGLNNSQWVDAIGAAPNSATRWLKDPTGMSAIYVERTCDLLGVTVDYLRCTTDYESETAKTLAPEQVKSYYEALSERHKRILSEILRDMVLCEVSVRLAQQHNVVES